MGRLSRWWCRVTGAHRLAVEFRPGVGGHGSFRCPRCGFIAWVHIGGDGRVVAETRG